jgi:Mat/Ecp fimbriae major subunit
LRILENIMKKSKFKRLATLACLPFGVVSFYELTSTPAMAATASVPASATVLPPVAVTVTQNLRFGTLAAAGTASNVTIAPPATAASGANIGTRVASAAGVALIGHTGAVTTAQACSAISACGAAVLTVTGGASTTLNTVTITPPATLVSGANTMAFSAVTRSPTGTLVLSATGGLTVNIGGTLAVGATQASGAYAGTISVTLDY